MFEEAFECSFHCAESWLLKILTSPTTVSGTVEVRVEEAVTKGREDKRKTPSTLCG